MKPEQKNVKVRKECLHPTVKSSGIYHTGLHEVYSQDKVAFVQTILANPSLTGFEKASRIANCIDGIFMTFHFGIRHPNRCYDLDWVQLEEVLDLEEEHLVSDDWHPKDRYESDEWNGFVSFNSVNLAIVYAATNNTEMFEQYVDLILDDIKRSVTWCIEHDMHWTRFLSLKSYDNLHLLSLVNGLSFIKKFSSDNAQILFNLFI